MASARAERMERAHAAEMRLRIDSTHDRVGCVSVRGRADDAGPPDVEVPELRVSNGRRLRRSKQNGATAVSGSSQGTRGLEFPRFGRTRHEVQRTVPLAR